MRQIRRCVGNDGRRFPVFLNGGHELLECYVTEARHEHLKNPEVYVLESILSEKDYILSAWFRSCVSVQKRSYSLEQCARETRKKN